MALQIVQQVGVGLILDPEVLHILHIVGVGGGNHHIARCTVHVGKPLEQTGMVQRHHPHQLTVYQLLGGFTQIDLAAQ